MNNEQAFWILISIQGFPCALAQRTYLFWLLCPSLRTSLSGTAVGPNGSGKSSLLAGMKFVMGDSSVERTYCLHQGASAKVMVGFVSAVFENSNPRLTGVRQCDATLYQVTPAGYQHYDQNTYTAAALVTIGTFHFLFTLTFCECCPAKLLAMYLLFVSRHNYDLRVMVWVTSRTALLIELLW